MREEGVRIVLRSHSDADIEASIERAEEDGGGFCLWLTTTEGEKSSSFQLTSEEARALAGSLERLASLLDRHSNWNGWAQ